MIIQLPLCVLLLHTTDGFPFISTLEVPRPQEVVVLVMLMRAMLNGVAFGGSMSGNYKSFSGIAALSAGGTIDAYVSHAYGSGNTDLSSFTVNCDTCVPTLTPSVKPTTLFPSVKPSEAPTKEPTLSPTVMPSVQPTLIPSVRPTDIPSAYPSSRPSSVPTTAPVKETVTQTLVILV